MLIKERYKRVAGRVGTEHKARGGELFPTLAVSCQASVVRGEEVGRFREVAGVSIVAAECPRSAVDTSTVHSRVIIQYYDLGTSLQILRSYTLLLKHSFLYALTRHCIIV